MAQSGIEGDIFLYMGNVIKEKKLIALFKGIIISNLPRGERKIQIVAEMDETKSYCRLA